MARTEGFLPKVPLTYRGIEVCDHVANRWLSYEGTMWRMGIDQALDSVIESIESECKDLESGGDSWFPDDFMQGVDEGKERAADSVRDTLYNYKKESN